MLRGCDSEMPIEISITRFQPEYARLVNEVYERECGASGDEFDVLSNFVAARIDMKYVGIVRLTPGPDGPLQKWSIGPCPLPEGPNIIQMTRGVVRSTARGRGLYRLMMLRAMAFAFENAYLRAVAIIAPDFRQRQFLFDIGFAECAPQSMYRWFPNVEGPARNIICDLEKSHLKWGDAPLQRNPVAFATSEL